MLRGRSCKADAKTMHMHTPCRAQKQYEKGPGPKLKPRESLYVSVNGLYALVCGVFVTCFCISYASIYIRMFWLSAQFVSKALRSTEIYARCYSVSR